MDNLEKRVNVLEQKVGIIEVQYGNLKETVNDIKKDTESISSINLGINNIGLKLDNYVELTKKQDKSINEHTEKLQLLENKENKNIADIAKRITWSVVGIIIAALVSFLISQV